MKAELIETDPRHLATLSTEELRAELARGLRLTAEHLFRLGHVWLELEKRGEDLSALRKGLAVYLPMIASGRVDARAVVRFAGSALAMRQIASLPIDEQRRLAEGGTVAVATGSTVVAKDPATLSAAELRLVFGRGKIRPVLEQREILDATTRRDPLDNAVSYNRRTFSFRINGRGVTLAEIVAAVANAERYVQPGRKGLRSVEVVLPKALHASLHERARKARSSSIEALVTALLRVAGVFD